MSQIIHRCQVCQKPDYWQDGTTAGPTVDGKPITEPNRARSCCRSKRWGDPELAPTFDGAGRRIAAVIPPGGPAGAVGAKTCNCDDCHTFYAGLPEVAMAAG